MTINAGNITAVMAVLALAVTLLAAVGGGIYQLGQLNSRVDQLSAEVEQLPTHDEVRVLVAAESRRNNAEIREEIRRSNEENRRNNEQTRAENRRNNEETLEEMRRINQQLLHSLANHTHDADGQALFTVPPGAEPSSEQQPQ